MAGMEAVSEICPTDCGGGLCYPLTAGPATQCICPPGTTGPDCGSVSTSCSQTPCLHAGNCTDGEPGAQYSCNCAGTGHSGTYCEIENNSCTEGKCGNGGSCLDQPGGFLCACVPGFTGRTCAERLERPTARGISGAGMAGAADPCLADPAYCTNGGTCVYTASATASCTCGPGWTGPRCETALENDPCLGVQCGAGAACQAGVCSCPPGFTGDPAAACTKVDWCSAAPCQHGGTCQDTGPGYRCDCPAGWEGDNCETDTAECAVDSACQHGGTCTELAGGYSCACTEGWAGQDCSQDQDECSRTAAPCQHGVCRNMVTVSNLPHNVYQLSLPIRGLLQSQLIFLIIVPAAGKDKSL